MSAPFVHATILRDEVVRLIAPRAGGVYADVTLGGGGHAEAILEASGPDGRLLGIDRDPRALEAAGARLEPFGARVTLVHAELGALREVMAANGHALLDGLVADLGVSSPQLDDAERGFSFARTGPLDMRMDPTQGETARELAARLEESALADVIYTYGEERKSRPIARQIKRALERGELETTDDLRRAVVRVLGPHRGGADPATRTFQALRIAVNGELDQLAQLLAMLPDVLADDAVAAILSFHSLEDRRVKHAGRDEPRLSPVTKKPLEAGEEEQRQNPRSRSAKLRGLRRVPRAEAA